MMELTSTKLVTTTTSTTTPTAATTATSTTTPTAATTATSTTTATAATTATLLEKQTTKSTVIKTAMNQQHQQQQHNPHNINKTFSINKNNKTSNIDTTTTSLDKSWDLHVVSNEMPPSGDIRTQPTHRPSCAVEGANYKPPSFPPPLFQ